jgi:hypothetical protein
MSKSCETSFHNTRAKRGLKLAGAAALVGRLLQVDAAGVREGAHTIMHVHGTHRKVVLVADLELGQGTRHREGQGLHIPHLQAAKQHIRRQDW